MLVSAAVKVIFDDKELIICGARHPYCYETIHNIKRMLNLKDTKVEYVDGFVDDFNIFYDRKRAYEKAMEYHQLSTTTIVAKRDAGEYELYSEDLY